MYFPLILDLGLTLNLSYLYWIWFHAWIMKSRLACAFNIKEPDRQNARILCFSWPPSVWDGRWRGREESTCCTEIICKYVAIIATRFSMCKISTIPLWTNSLRCWITVLYLPRSARMSLWCSLVIYISTTLASVFITGIPFAFEPVVFHTINPHIWRLSCWGCKHLSFSFQGGSISILDISLISDLVRKKYCRI